MTLTPLKSLKPLKRLEATRHDRSGSPSGAYYMKGHWNNQRPIGIMVGEGKNEVAAVRPGCGDWHAVGEDETYHE
jgi:hypothetical protein